MKKLYSSLALLMIGLAGTVTAQTTLTSGSMPQIGYVYNMALDTVAADRITFTVSPGSGTAQNWNYTPMFNNLYPQSTTFVIPSSGAGSSNFPSSTMAVQQPNGTDWVYFVGNSGGLFIDGAYVNAQGSMVAVDYIPNATFVPTPFTYGNNNHVLSLATFTTTISGNTVQVRHRADRTINADAFGSLTTPTATYPNTLRIKTFEADIDSVFINVLGNWNFAQRRTDSTTTYTWMQNTQDAQLMQINMSKTGAVTKAQYLQSFSNGVAQISLPTTGLNLFPNPATNGAYLTYENKTPGAVSLQLFDIDGRLVGNILNQDQAMGVQKVFINLESMHLPKGLYFIHFKNADGLQTLKLAVN
ncbi:MAG TPA: T9SS type A sorting domain-containing protein [Bacteroidia bacterium]|jgi:hypothetical protein|nr:T9SS type A sorting domain-containing protein [Bacteroidia bacterium]